MYQSQPLEGDWDMLAFVQVMTQNFKIHFKFNPKLSQIAEKQDETRPFGIFTVVLKRLVVPYDICQPRSCNVYKVFQFLRTETAHWCLLANGLKITYNGAQVNIKTLASMTDICVYNITLINQLKEAAALAHAMKN